MERGTRVGQAYIALAISGDHVNESIADSVNKAGPDVEKAGQDHGERYGDEFESGFFGRLRQKFLPKIHKELGDKMGTEGEDAGKTAGEKITDGIKGALSDNSTVDRLGDRLGAHVGGHMVDAINHALTSGDFDGNALKQLFDKLMADAVSGNSGGGGRGSRPSKNDPTLGDRIGNVFGSGSRNNAIIPFQLTAHAAGGLINVIERVTKGVKSMFDNVSKGAEDTANITEQLTVNMGEFGKMVSSGFAALASGSVAIGVVAVAASVLASVLSALVAIVAALAATIVSALVAAAAVGAAGLLAMVSAAGLLMLAFKSLSIEQKKVLSADFKPVKNDLIGLGQIMTREMVPAFHQWADNIDRVLHLLAPLARVMGTAFGQAGTSLTKALSGPGVQRFITELGVTLPGITRNMTAAFGHLLNGLLAVFTPVLPLVQRFSRYLDDVTLRFTRWANSAKGQNQIVDFVNRAVVSLRSLWNFLGQVGGLITDVLFSASGQQTGNTLFDGMASAVQRFRGTITKANLEKWFRQGATLAKGLGDALKGLAKVFNALNSNGTVKAVAATLSTVSKVVGVLLKYTPNLSSVGKIVGSIAGKISDAFSTTDKVSAQAAAHFQTNMDLIQASGTNSLAAVQLAALNTTAAIQNMNQVAASSNPWKNFYTPPPPSAANNTGGNSGAGGNIPSPSSTSTPKPPKGPKPPFHNPFLGIANAILNSGPSISAQIKNAMITVNKQIANALASIDSAADVNAANSGINTLVQNVTASIQSTVNTARDAVQSAAQTLASASSLAAAKRALAQLRARQHDLAVAIADQKKLQQQIKFLQAQKIQHSSLTDAFNALIGKGTSDALASAAALLTKSNLTLADFAKMRSQLAAKIQSANQELQTALQLRNSYQTQVSDSIKAFGALTSAQAQVINGISQTLTSNDIISNLQDKLKQIQDFQTNLNLLLAMGLSNDAYKQIVDAGVEAGSAYAQALVTGGSGAVDQVNGLVKSTNNIADQLGTQASSRMYQAGVDAAQGLVDGLTSLSGQLDAAATQLGNTIANAVKKSLGIKSPSTRLRAMMGFVGDGAALGLDDQGPKISAAASRFASRIAVSPEVASYASRQGSSPTVSGNHNEHHWHITTPTQDPQTVALEMMNEVTGRLP